MKHIATISAILLSVITFSCSKNETPEAAEVKEAGIDATSKTTWTYFSLCNGEAVGTGEENESDNALWAARQDWDIAICRYSIRTNSGTSSSTGAKGGVYASSESFEDLVSVPSGTVFEEDEVVTSSGMSGESSTSKSTATVITFKTNADGSKVMPPVYMKAPVYVFRCADGAKLYKVEFTQYQDEEKITGKVKFRYSSMQ